MVFFVWDEIIAFYWNCILLQGTLAYDNKPWLCESMFGPRCYEVYSWVVPVKPKLMSRMLRSNEFIGFLLRYSEKLWSVCYPGKHPCMNTVKACGVLFYSYREHEVKEQGPQQGILWIGNTSLVYNRPVQESNNWGRICSAI